MDDEFTSNDELVARADSFMQRQRPAAPPPIPVLTETVVPGIDPDDLPVLTEVVGEHAGTGGPRPTTPAAAVASEAPATSREPAFHEPVSHAPVPASLAAPAVEAVPAQYAQATATPAADDPELLADFTHFISRRFLAELPALIHTALQTSMSGHPGELRGDVQAIAETARQDFLAELKARQRR